MNTHARALTSARTWAAFLFVLLLGGCDDIRMEDFVPFHATLTRSEVEPPGAQCEHGGTVVFAGQDENDDGVLAESEVDTARYVCARPLPTVLTRTRQEPSGAHCEHGGHAVETGPDANDDELLSDSEVTTTRYVCADALPVVLLHTRAEPAGAHCERGGRAVETGLDVDASGKLESTEVIATEYVCATAYPGVLVRTVQVPKGATCPHGGQLTHAGSDTDGDGLLSKEEATREVVSCLEPEPVLSRLVLLGVRPEPCGTQNAYAVEAGLDLDLDGVLDDDEVRATSRLCNPMVPLLRRHREEPPGARCITGGVAVMVGGDLNGDNDLQDDEVRHTVYVCQPSATFHGDYELRDVSDAVALQSIARVRGSLLISAPELREFIHPGLESVEGSLTVQDNSMMTRLELPSLRFVRGDITVTDHPRLTGVTLGSIDALGYPLWVSGSLRVERNSALTDLSGLGRVAPRLDFVLRKNNQLTVPGQFPFVEGLRGDLVIEFNDLLPAPPVFSHLLDIGGTLNLRGNPALGTLAGLRTLQRINEDLLIESSDSLTSISELSKLTSVGSVLSVMHNNELRTLSLPSLSRALTKLHVEENLKLEEVGPFSSMLETGDFLLLENPELLRVIGLGAPLNISGDLVIVGSKKLESLGAFAAVTSLRSLTVEYCDALTNLEGLHHVVTLKTLVVRQNPGLTALRLDALTNVSSEFKVMFNDWLPACQVIALAEAVHTGPLDQRYTRSNYEGAICAAPP
ncbi:DUF7151 family protein [Myxococcus landrumensis]|uniref:DUF7151 domain-containing protein n=1 Tax=Myxococcus landrumensis TaxID=2813577 RepID=A0ABX7N2R7_9BACT|nr:hypothetical protein [Myxococcus landrumus]QSQ12729.1 hypothetical protein JY572_30920 [Myxococcus landrumus]